MWDREVLTRVTDRSLWLPRWWGWGRKGEGCSLVESQISGPQNGRFTAMGILKEQLLSKGDDFRHRHVVWSIYGI